ncbi:Hypothetical protein PHPALM_13083 [Phytophthora palmivora]|uniref:Uncharacterized protein n=1 Tax=Phytophthora palmivora TaxID=4796 RepID=A0A2P4XY49_9STRA|nr:Hypothetical protein PHPALM_13083 [Phytophthora palmivora]
MSENIHLKGGEDGALCQERLKALRDFQGLKGNVINIVEEGDASYHAAGVLAVVVDLCPGTIGLDLLQEVDPFHDYDCDRGCDLLDEIALVGGSNHLNQHQDHASEQDQEQGQGQHRYQEKVASSMDPISISAILGLFCK